MGWSETLTTMSWTVRKVEGSKEVTSLCGFMGHQTTLVIEMRRI